MKHKFSFALAVITSLLVTKVEASSRWHWPWESDIYRGPKLPTACKSGGLLFTVPALQGMQEHKLSIDEVTRIVNPYLEKSDIIHDGNTVVILRRNGKEVEVSSVWQE